jgi:flagellar biogenesis protein FliO
MHTVPGSFLAAIGIPAARQCLAFLAPFLIVAISYWMVKRMDHVVERLFPDGEWEKRLGWLNIQAEIQANRFFRWIGYVSYSILTAALYGIVWGAQAVPSVVHWDNPYVLSELLLRVLAMVMSLALLLVYFGVWLIPKLRNEYEMELLKKFQLEQKRLEEEEEREKEALRKEYLSNPNFRSFGQSPSDRLGPQRL